MLKKLGVFFAVFVFAVSLAGCATARKQKDLEMQGLRNQVSALEAKVQEKDTEIMNLRDMLTKSAEEKANLEKRTRLIGEVKSRPNVKQIQTALENAGYNPGAIDGRMGRKTRDAIKEFQRTHNLRTDGKVGKKTWVLLKEYLYKKNK